ncbi:MAG: transcription termination/antitermination protein NusG [Treponema sp.]|jgi:transcriptional antiterminator NusG|nr:transcription termination/antitermination protein NusG [Treponema sp.]
MAASWYILHTYSGYENKIEKTIRTMIENQELDREVVQDIKVLSEDVVEVKDGKKRTTTKKFLPGYILVSMDLPDLAWKVPISKIKRIEGVTGFLGVTTDKKPRPISANEARSILQKSGEIKGERPVRARQTFSAGEPVKIIDGPFESFSGVIEEVNQERNKLKVMVGIFGRSTPVEVDLLQVEKL